MVSRGKGGGKYAIRLYEDEHNVGVDGWGLGVCEIEDDEKQHWRFLKLVKPNSPHELLWRFHSENTIKF